MGRFEDFRQYAADCVRQAEAQQKPEDRDILLNVALAWVRLAQQSQAAPAVDDSQAEESDLPGGKPAQPKLDWDQPASPPAAA